ncbi:GNAT family N-acetyltransferase [Thiomicrorhabdus sp. Milos-T2]|uniref:GNAT family N-acetyltransferase n=1 Tax=Thiomicrorhabdus sp. Milos-T2 TaxID=90814 RepID=UPI000493DDB5|nr:GNAT family N-acetyltransferase [Thiomicrorhabdus sp. Milos-T2]
MNTVLLSKVKHDRKTFDCGIDSLNNYLKLTAGQSSKRDNARTFVLEDELNDSQITGFYTLTMTTLNLESLPTALQKKYAHSKSAGLIARLAVDKNYKGKGLGEWLLIDALKKLLLASDTVGFPLVLVDAKDGAKEFYQKYGFTSFIDTENRLFVTISDIRASFQ